MHAIAGEGKAAIHQHQVIAVFKNASIFADLMQTAEGNHPQGGLLVGGVYFTVDNKINRETYGENATVGEILSDKLPKPQGATILTQALDGN